MVLDSQGFFFSLISVGDDGSSLAKMNAPIFTSDDSSFIGGDDSSHLPTLLLVLTLAKMESFFLHFPFYCHLFNCQSKFDYFSFFIFFAVCHVKGTSLT